MDSISDNSTHWVDDVIASTPVARLGTSANDEVRLVPVCFAVVDRWIVSAVDHKPKRTGQLRRLDDMSATGTATLLLDHYDDDWTQLWWVRIRGRAEVHAPGEPDAVRAVDALAAKYHQYRQNPPTGSVFRIAMDELRWWRWTEPWNKQFTQ